MTTPSSRAALRLTVLSSAAFLLAACSGAGAASTANNGADPAAQTAQAPDEVTPGGTLSFAVGSDQGCVDPAQVGIVVDTFHLWWDREPAIMDLSRDWL